MAGGVQVKINNRLYPLDDLLDKTIYAAKDTLLYRNPGDTSAKFQVAKGGLIGKLWSWKTQPDGIWLGYYTNSLSIKKEYPSGYYWTKISDIDEDSLKQQGVVDSKTKEEERKKKEEEQNMTLTDKFFKEGKTVLFTGLGIYAGLQVVKMIIGNK